MFSGKDTILLCTGHENSHLQSAACVMRAKPAISLGLCGTLTRTRPEEVFEATCRQEETETWVDRYNQMVNSSSKMSMQLWVG